MRGCNERLLVEVWVGLGVPLVGRRGTSFLGDTRKRRCTVANKRQLSVKVWIGVGVPVVTRRGMTPSEHTKARRRVMAKQGSYRCIDGR